ncbi:hypothetical protein D3C80_2143660 [compost metagenome]
MEGLLECNDLVAVRPFDLLMVAPRQLDRRFVRFGTAVAEEDDVRTADLRQLPRCSFLLRDVEKVAHMP